MLIKFWRKIFRRVSHRVLHNRKIRHYQPSLIFTPEDIVANQFLIQLLAQALPLAWRTQIKPPKPELEDTGYYNVFPGEHYRLLRAITQILQPSTVVEVGTFTGMGAVAMRQGMASGQIVTFDIMPWQSFPSHLQEADFANGQIQQRLADLSDPQTFAAHLELLNAADILFVDAPKDGLFEYRFLPLLSKLSTDRTRLLILDDIRFVNMVDLWRSIASPKLDVSGIAHWSGTGLVDISQGLKLRPI